MKNKQKNEMTFGDLVAATYQVWGADLASKMLQFAIASRLVVVRAQPHVLISSAKGRPV